LTNCKHVMIMLN